MDSERAGRPEAAPPAPPPFVRVAPSLFLGSARAAAAPELLARAGVTLCVNVSRQQPGPSAPGVGELRVPVFDDPAEDLLVHLEPTCAAMEAAVRAGGACLVYCKNGRSRSAAVCTAYLMRHRGLGLEAAFQVRQGGTSGGEDFLEGRGSGVGGPSGRADFRTGSDFVGRPAPEESVGMVARSSARASRSQAVKSARPVAEPNPGFWAQLQKYEEALQSRSLLPRSARDSEP